MQYATTGASDQHLQKRYLLVTRENKYIVLQYYIGVQYTDYSGKLAHALKCVQRMGSAV